MSLAVNLPINSVSFGQISTALIRNLYEKDNNIDLNIIPIGNNLDLSSQSVLDKNFTDWLEKSTFNALKKHSRKDKIFKLWHLNGSLESFSEKQILLSFYELDSPTQEELNTVRNNHKVFFTSNYTVDIFKNHGCDNVSFLPLFFDKYNFSIKEKKYFSDNRIVFNLVGKLERRKHHQKVLTSWVKRFGNNSKYSLQCSIFNPFMDPKQQSDILNSWLNGKSYFNVSFLNFMQKNSSYNDYLNSGDIVIGMSGGEGWGLPEFHSVALGKHSVILKAHSYLDWADDGNSVLVNPSKDKISAIDGVFFHPNHPFNQGNIFDFNEDEFINGCEKAIQRVESNRINEKGLELSKNFNLDKFTDSILNHLK